MTSRALPAPLAAPSAATPRPTRAAAAPRRRIVDAPMRMFHALFALSFAGAYLSAEGESWRALHVTLGYTFLGLLAFRIVYGFFGPAPARWSALARKLGGVGPWLRGLWHAAARRTAPPAGTWRQGQNVAMVVAVLALLALAAPLGLSGVAAYHEWLEPLVGDAFASVHEALGEAMLAIVVAHLALIAGLSLLRRRNMAAPMLSGHADGPGPDLVKHNRGTLALLLLAAVVGYGAWEWQQSPHGLVTPAAWASVLQPHPHTSHAAGTGAHTDADAHAHTRADTNTD